MIKRRVVWMERQLYIQTTRTGGCRGSEPGASAQWVPKSDRLLGGQAPDGKTAGDRGLQPGPVPVDGLARWRDDPVGDFG